MFDYAVFREDRYVTNAMLTTKQAAEMEARGYRCIRTEGKVDTGLPVFRGRRYVRPNLRDSRRWDR